MRRGWAPALCVVAVLGSSISARAQESETPYWASIAAGRAHIRTGPGRNYPASWLYRREGLPVRVVRVYREWRQIEDPEGTQGWMLATLLSRERTAIVRDGVQTMHERPDDGARIVYRVEGEVSGRLRRCENGWCQLDVAGRRGFIRARHLWGVDNGETVR